MIDTLKDYQLYLNRQHASIKFTMKIENNGAYLRRTFDGMCHPHLQQKRFVINTLLRRAYKTKDILRRRKKLERECRSVKN